MTFFTRCRRHLRGATQKLRNLKTEKLKNKTFPILNVLLKIFHNSENDQVLRQSQNVLLKTGNIFQVAPRRGFYKVSVGFSMGNVFYKK